jgi:hypothetical protein
VHPYYRYRYSTTVVVSFGFTTHAWVDTWVPPSRAGWAWSPGYYSYGYYNPGYWRPVAPAPAHYLYVAGHWDRETYVEGFYRPEQRDDGDWEWLEGAYLDNGVYAPGHWRPLMDPPDDGYLWEPGFWDGETWVEGFWRPEFRSDYTWLSAYYDEDGVYHAGYWLPQLDQGGYTWVPGWFDGNTWVEGYWVVNEEWSSADIDGYVPEQGYDDGWELGAGWGDGEVLESEADASAAEVPDLPLGVPVAIPQPDN